MFIGHFVRHLFKSLVYYSLLIWGNSLYILDRSPLAVCVLKKTQIFSRHIKIVTGSQLEALPSASPHPPQHCAMLGDVSQRAFRQHTHGWVRI